MAYNEYVFKLNIFFLFFEKIFCLNTMLCFLFLITYQFGKKINTNK